MRVKFRGVAEEAVSLNLKHPGFLRERASECAPHRKRLLMVAHREAAKIDHHWRTPDKEVRGHFVQYNCTEQVSIKWYDIKKQKQSFTIALMIKYIAHI